MGRSSNAAATDTVSRLGLEHAEESVIADRLRFNGDVAPGGKRHVRSVLVSDNQLPSDAERRICC